MCVYYTHTHAYIYIDTTLGQTTKFHSENQINYHDFVHDKHNISIRIVDNGLSIYTCIKFTNRFLLSTLSSVQMYCCYQDSCFTDICLYYHNKIRIECVDVRDGYVLIPFISPNPIEFRNVITNAKQCIDIYIPIYEYIKFNLECEIGVYKP